MKIELKPLNEQVVVITGASSGIGLATARLAAKRGARVVLTSRDKADLKKAVRSIQDAGGEATYAVADVADLDGLRGVAGHAVREFGGIDTWINNAGVSIYGRIEEVSPEDARRLFETNYWGVVNGSLVAVEHLRANGGALVNVGSVLSDRAIPLQGHYSASKHAVKGFTDALRMELEEEGAPVSVSLVKPSSIDTPYTQHARNLMDREPSLPPPVYSPRVVARTILRCAEQPVRDVTVGAGGRMLAGMGNVSPRLADRYMESTIFDQQKGDEPAPRRRRDTLFRPRRGDVEERGGYPGHVAKTSAYTGVKLHPIRTALAVAALGAGVAMALRSEGGVLGGFGEGSGDWTAGD
ncbi:MAG TPA: SDR family oxidoreductase [Longimicrobiaceae bacterium]|nr:SDR family oxidoreductase [Longimicrobiaceae bacterium]